MRGKSDMRVKMTQKPKAWSPRAHAISSQGGGRLIMASNGTQNNGQVPLQAVELSGSHMPASQCQCIAAKLWKNHEVGFLCLGKMKCKIPMEKAMEAKMAKCAI